MFYYPFFNVPVHSLLFYNIVIIHVADLLIMFCFCNKYCLVNEYLFNFCAL